jgi:hypothetical protein
MVATICLVLLLLYVTGQTFHALEERIEKLERDLRRLRKQLEVS